jgi:hypothetical protein
LRSKSAVIRTIAKSLQNEVPEPSQIEVQTERRRGFSALLIRSFDLQISKSQNESSTSISNMNAKGFAGVYPSAPGTCVRTLNRRTPHRASIRLVGKAAVTDISNNGELSKYIRHCLQDDGIANSALDDEAQHLKSAVSKLQTANEDLKTEMGQLASQLGELVRAAETAARTAEAAASHRLHPPPLGPATALPRDKLPADAEINCSLHHPGALFCTTASTWRDEDVVAITAALETTVTATADAVQRGHIDVDAIEALASHAVASAAAKLARKRAKHLRQQHVSVAEAKAHEDICRVMAEGEILTARPNPVTSPFGHESFVCEIFDARKQRRIKALFKPRVPGDADGWHRAPMETIAYRLSRLLGMDLVPPSCYRGAGVSLPLVDDVGNFQGQRWFDEGAMSYWVDDAKPLADVPTSQWGVDAELLLSDTRVLDVLLHNSDRHAGHFLMGRHWALGKWEDGRWRGEMRPCLIDHAASFRAEAEVCCTHENAFKTGPLRKVSAQTLLLLRLLRPEDVKEAAEGLLTAGEVAGVAARQEAVLDYVMDLVSKNGYALTMLG